MSFAHLLDRRRGAVGAIALGMAIAASPAYAKEVTWDDIVNDAETPENVLMYGFGPKAQRFSPMDHINADNVERLRPAWQFSFGDEKQRGQETQPVVFDGKIYLTASYSRMFALDSATGEKIWDYSHRLPDDIRPCCDVVNRGPAIYGDKLFFGTLDANLVALNKDSGEVVWNENFDDHKAGYTMTGAPTIIKDQKTGKIMLIHGNSGDEFGALGKLYARNPDTGEELWMRPLVEGHVGRKGGEQSTPTGDPEAPSWPDGDYNDTGKAEAWSHGGGAPWQSASFDVSTNTIIIGAGNPAPWNTWARTGESGNPRDYESLYTSGQAYVEPSTGELVGFYQHTPNDAWDFSGNNEIILFDFEKDGKTMQAGAHADRNGYFFLTDTQKLAERGGEINKPTALLAAYPFVDNITWTDGYNLETGKPNEVEGQRPPQIKEGEDRGESIQVSPPFLGGARTGTRCPTARIPACSISRPTTGPRITGPRTSSTRRARPISVRVFVFTRCTTTTSAPCGPWTRPPARSSGNITRSCRSGPGPWPPRATSCLPAPAMATSRPSMPKPAKSSGATTPVPAWSGCRSPGSRTANSMWASRPATAAPCRCGVATLPI